MNIFGAETKRAMTPHLNRIMEEGFEKKKSYFASAYPGECYQAGFQSATDILLPLIGECQKALEFYNLGYKDCAGLALSKIEQTLEGE